MKKSAALFVLLVILVPAVLVYLAAALYARHHHESLQQRAIQDSKTAVEHIVKLNELRRTMPGRTVAEISALVFPPLPQSYLLRPLTAAERARHPALKDSDYLVQHTAPPYHSIPGAAPHLQLDLTADSHAPAAPSTPAPAR